MSGSNDYKIEHIRIYIIDNMNIEKEMIEECPVARPTMKEF